MQASEQPERRLARNALRCLQCNTVIESVHRHDYVVCPCKSAFIDGGLTYVRWGAYSPDDVELLTEYADDNSA